MKILLICSKSFYGKLEEIKKTLQSYGHEISMPNCYDAPETEQKMWNLGKNEHAKFKAKMFKQSHETISQMDAVLVLNYNKVKDGITYKNYIGGATFLEMHDAFLLNKKIFILNNIQPGPLSDEIEGFNPIVINGDLSCIK